MINVTISYKPTININIEGHANYSEHGSDIVCSAVSILAITISNKLVGLNKDVKLVVQEGQDARLNIELVSLDQESKLLIDTLIDGLKSISEEYDSYINIKETNND